MEFYPKTLKNTRVLKVFYHKNSPPKKKYLEFSKIQNSKKEFRKARGFLEFYGMGQNEVFFKFMYKKNMFF